MSQPPLGYRNTGVRWSATGGLLILAIFYTLYFAAELIMPIVLAVLFTLLFAPVVRALKRIYVPEYLGAAIIVLVLLAILGTAIILLMEPASEWIRRAPRILQELEAKVEPLRQAMEQISRAARHVEELATVEEPQRAVQVNEGGLREQLFLRTQQLLTGGVIVFFLLYFLLAFGDRLFQKSLRLVRTADGKRSAVEMAQRVQEEISRYLVTITFINIILGVSVAGALYLVGMPNPVLWGVLAGLMNYIPYIGPLLTAIVFTVVSLLTFEELTRALWPPAIFIVLTTLEGQLMTPIIIGHRLALNVVVVFLGVVFWGWIWGVPGALMAVPLLAIAKIIFDNTESLRALGDLLGR